jgi:hypothetical protein
MFISELNKSVERKNLVFSLHGEIDVIERENEIFSL